MTRRVHHRFNPELGPGRIVAEHDRTVEVEFPESGTVLRVARDSNALVPVTFPPGSRARLEATGETVVIDEHLGGARVLLADGREVEEDDLWPLDLGGSPFERLAEGRVDPHEDFALRIDALHLAEVREADGLGSFLGGRIEIFPHQLHVAERATRADPVRWLLADEVGLGKTVEACLVLNRLLRTGRADRTLVVAPDTLTVQWLGELWRKYHQVFVLVDDQRLRDVEVDYGTGFNPFDAYRRAIVATERLESQPRLVEQAVAAGIDLLIVDEAHRLRRPAGHPGNPAYRAVRPIADLGRHVLLLTATPLEDDARGFYRLLQILRPDEFPEDEEFGARLARREPLPPCTSATRRADIGGLPPRVGSAVALDEPDAWAPLERLERALLAEPADDPVGARRKAGRLERARSSAAALAAALPRSAGPLRELADAAAAADPRIRWLAERARAWRDRGEKTLVFTAHRETLELVREEVGRLAHVAIAVFHEDLPTTRRDVEVAQFRLPSGPSILISTECGGEGRNFQFCTRLVLFDLPWDPVVVEQRIGRLDRIGRREPVRIVYFRPPFGIAATVADLHRDLGLFEEPLGGLETELAEVRPALAAAVAAGRDALEPAVRDALVARTGAARDRIREAAYHELHRDPYRPELADAILARVPEDLEELTEEVVVTALERLGLHVERQRGVATYGVEFGNRAVVESLPGVSGGSAFVGTFDRREGVEDEGLDFFAAGHALVEGVLAHLEETPRGRVGLIHLADSGKAGFGLAAFHRVDGRLRAVVVDLEGRDRRDWAERLLRHPLRTRRARPESWIRQPEWGVLIRILAARLERLGRPEAVAAVRIGG